MLGDVLEAARACAARVRLVTDDDAAMSLAAELEAEAVAEPGGGQGPAVAGALIGVQGVCLVVNADLPCISPASLLRLAARCPSLVAAPDGTTNALSLPDPSAFRALYGSGSAARFAAAGFHAAPISELEQDVDTLADVARLTHPVGPRTTLVLDRHDVRPVVES